MKKINTLIIAGFALFITTGIAGADELDDLEVTVRVVESDDDANEVENEISLPYAIREDDDREDDKDDDRGGRDDDDRDEHEEHDEHDEDREEHEEDREDQKEDQEEHEDGEEGEEHHSELESDGDSTPTV